LKAVVIGACFGDEGKGLVTDFFASHHTKNCLVVRFNGGAQAGHTVQTPDGKRHVFKHFGSGSFNGAHSYLSEYFICNPLLFRDEYEILRTNKLQPVTYVHANSAVTTHFDIIINQIIEIKRGNAKHGSCGIGIGETIERNNNPEFALTVSDLFGTKESLLLKLEHISKNWVYTRLEQLAVTHLSAEWQARIESVDLINYYLYEVEFFKKHIEITNNSIIQDFSAVIFEGAQGLLLDQNAGTFPHVTRSNTGLTNVLAIAKDMNIQELDVYYVARTYLTRHGAGPLLFELPGPPYPRIVDNTNLTNEFQGKLRFAWFNLDLLQQAIFSDLAQVPHTITIRANLFISCLDQIEYTIGIIINNKLKHVTKQKFLQLLQTIFQDFKIWQSHGPSRDSITVV